MTIKDVAEYCGVSVSTVSRVLNDHPDVSDEVRARVLDAVQKLHYVPNRAARDLVRTDVESIGLVVRGAENPFFASIIRAIEGRCEDSDYTMVLRQIPTDADEVADASELVNSKRLKGVILLGGRFDYSREEVASIGVPFVCCTYTNSFGDIDDESYSSVSIDDVDAGYRATRELVDCGHSRIAILLDARHSHSISELRFQGYRRALEEAGIALDDDLVVEAGDFSMAAAYDAVCDLLSRRRDVTAIFSVSDLMAMAAIKAVTDSGFTVPKGCSVIGIDGIEMSRYSIPTLTTLEQPQVVLGETAMDILLDVLSGKAKSRHVRLEAQLRTGGTVAPRR